MDINTFFLRTKGLHHTCNLLITSWNNSLCKDKREKIKAHLWIIYKRLIDSKRVLRYAIIEEQRTHSTYFYEKILQEPINGLSNILWCQKTSCIRKNLIPIIL